MKIKKIFINVAVILILSVCCTVVAFAASSVPSLELRETGIKNQYSITFRNWSSEYYGVEFDIAINQSNLNFDMEWLDKQESSYQNVKSEQSGDKTVLKFYYAKRTPISNSNSARIGEITLPNLNSNSKFTTSGNITLVDGNAQKIQFYDMNISVVTIPSGGGNSGESGGSNGSDNFVPMLDWSDLKNQVKVGNDGVKRINISLEKNPYIYTDILQELKNGKIIATFKYKDYQWEIDGSSIKTLPQDRIYYDLSVEKLFLKNISATVDNTDILQFETTFKGSLPFTATLIYPIGIQYADKTVYVSNYNEQNGILSYQTNTKIDENGNIRVSFTNLDKHVVTLRNFWNTQPVAPESNVTENQTTSQPTEQQNVDLIVPGIDSAEIEKVEQSEQIEKEDKSDVESSLTEVPFDSEKKTNILIYIILMVGIALLVFIAIRAVVYFQMIKKIKHRKRKQNIQSKTDINSKK